MKKKKIYLLNHFEEAEQGIYLLRGIGHYSTYKKAKEDRKKYKKKKGFKRLPNNFVIKEITIDKTRKIQFFKIR